MVVKKIRLDFSKTEERSGWNTRQIPEGLHKMKIESFQETEAQDGTAMLVYALVPTDSKYKSRKFPYYCKLQQNQLWKLRDLLVAAGQEVPKKAISIDPGVVVGKLIAAEVEDDSYQGNVRSSVQGTYGLDILDEAGDDSDVEDDEEYEDEESEEDYDDSEEDTEEEFDEDEADEDDDLDEEELEDEFEDDEEEEEEEEPAPAKRRAAPAKAAPARRAAPARAAAPAARRTVKRR